jgi:hypothetical protein
MLMAMLDGKPNRIYGGADRDPPSSFVFLELTT